MLHGGHLQICFSELPICTERLVIWTIKYCRRKPIFFTVNLYLYLSVSVPKKMRKRKPILHTEKSLFVTENTQDGIFAARKTTFSILYLIFVLQRTINEAKANVPIWTIIICNDIWRNWNTHFVLPIYFTVERICYLAFRIRVNKLSLVPVPYPPPPPLCQDATPPAPPPYSNISPSCSLL